MNENLNNEINKEIEEYNKLYDEAFEAISEDNFSKVDNVFMVIGATAIVGMAAYCGCKAGKFIGEKISKKREERKLRKMFRNSIEKEMDNIISNIFKDEVNFEFDPFKNMK